MREKKKEKKVKRDFIRLGGSRRTGRANGNVRKT